MATLVRTDQIQNPYKFLYYRNAAANSGNAAFAQVAFDTKVFDTGSNVTTGTFTAPAAGFYQFNFQVDGTTAAASGTFTASLFKNAVEYSRGGQLAYTAAVALGVPGSSIIQLALNDTIDVRCFASTTAALSVGSTTQCYFSGFLVSAT